MYTNERKRAWACIVLYSMNQQPYFSGRMLMTLGCSATLYATIAHTSYPCTGIISAQCPVKFQDVVGLKPQSRMWNLHSRQPSFTICCSYSSQSAPMEIQTRPSCIAASEIVRMHHNQLQKVYNRSTNRTLSARGNSGELLASCGRKPIHLGPILLRRAASTHA